MMAHLLGFLGFCLQGGALCMIGLWIFGVIDWPRYVVWPAFFAMGFLGMIAIGGCKMLAERNQ